MLERTSSFDRFLDTANAFLWQNTVLFIILGTGIVFTILRGDPNPQSGNDLHRLSGSVEMGDTGPLLRWKTLESRLEPQLKDGGVYVS